jgi:hypothetical protein
MITNKVKRGIDRGWIGSILYIIGERLGMLGIHGIKVSTTNGER